MTQQTDLGKTKNDQQQEPEPSRDATRRVVQIAVMQPSHVPYTADCDGVLYALCADGTLWTMNAGHAWMRVTPIPATDYEAPL